LIEVVDADAVGGVEEAADDAVAVGGWSDLGGLGGVDAVEDEVEVTSFAGDAAGGEAGVGDLLGDVDDAGEGLFDVEAFDDGLGAVEDAAEDVGVGG